MRNIFGSSITLLQAILSISKHGVKITRRPNLKRLLNVNFPADTPWRLGHICNTKIPQFISMWVFKVSSGTKVECFFLNAVNLLMYS